mgnify:CR=1 FL=1
MKTIGLIGGSTWHSTKTYYQLINEEVNARLGNNHSAELLLYSMDFQEVMVKHWHNWDEIEKRLLKMVHCVEHGGADLLALCANTLHKSADAISKQSNLPLIHIGDAIGKRLHQKQIKKAVLLGSIPTMNEGFIKNRLKASYGISVFIPNRFDQLRVEEIIEKELTRGIIKDSSRSFFIDIIDWFEDNGAEAVILGCTEIPMLISQDDVNCFVVDSTKIHVEAIVDEALSA